jgi:hypothetical protein
LGVLATGLAIAVVVIQHTSWRQLVAFAIAPDLALLYGAGSALQRGQLHPRAVPVYNAVHRLWVPAILVAFMVVLQSPGWLAGGLAWIAHIAFDRTLGFGLRNPEGFQRA